MRLSAIFMQAKESKEEYQLAKRRRLETLQNPRVVLTEGYTYFGDATWKARLAKCGYLACFGRGKDHII